MYNTEKSQGRILDVKTPTMQMIIVLGYILLKLKGIGANTDVWIIAKL